MRMPDGSMFTHKGWNDEKGKGVTAELCSQLDVVNEKSYDNVLRISA